MPSTACGTWGGASGKSRPSLVDSPASRLGIFGQCLIAERFQARSAEEDVDAVAGSRRGSRRVFWGALLSRSRAGAQEGTRKEHGHECRQQPEIRP